MYKLRGTKIGTWIRKSGISPVLGLLIGIVSVVVYWPGVFGYAIGLKQYIALKPFLSMDLRIGDLLHRAFAGGVPAARPPRICIVGKTQEGSPEDMGPAEVRQAHAKVIRDLSSMGAGVIALDFDLIGDQPGDDGLTEAIRQSGRVVLGRRGMMQDPIPMMDMQEGASAGPTMSLALSSGRAERWSDGAYRMPMRPMNPALEKAAKGAGHVNLLYDPDLIARRVPAAIGDTRDSRLYVPLAVAALMAFENRSASDIYMGRDHLRFGDPKLAIPLGVDGAIPVNFHPVRRMVDMRPYSLRGQTGSSLAGKDAPPIQFYSYSDVLNNEIPRDAFAGAIVFVSSLGQNGMYVTPVGSQYPVVAQAMLLHSITTRSLLTPVKPIWTVLAMLAASAFIAMLCFGISFHGSSVKVVLGGMLMLAIGVAAVLLGVGLLRHAGWILETTPFLLVFGLNVACGVAANAARMSEEADRRNREMELLLVAGKRHLTEFSLQETPGDSVIPGSDVMARSESLSKRTPDVVAETFWQTLPCEGCVLFVLSDQSALSFSRAVCHGFKQEISREEAEALSVRFAWETLKEGRSIVRSRRGNAWLPAYAPESLRSMMAVPIVARGQPMAVAVLINKVATVSSPEKEFTEDDLRLTAALRYQAAALLENAQRYQHEYDMFDGFARALAKAVDYRDRYTHGHSDRVARLCVGIAEEIGLSKEEVEVVQRAAILHDLGKIGVSDIVLNKPGRLTSEEFALIRAHAANGYDILSATPSFEALLPGIRHHHERYDGMGYPDGLAGNDIPLLARIIAAADAFDAMTSNRPYRRALPFARACQELVAGSGTQFDPKIVQALLGYLQKRKRAKEIDRQPAAIVPRVDPIETCDTTINLSPMSSLSASLKR
jgi:HD-GYP domain-containing protein (c-di-GMP phosphodiesterase class II)/CHASE2 domain-containing sensor protein